MKCLQHLKIYKCIGGNHIFIFNMCFYSSQKKQIGSALLLTQYLNSDISYLSRDINCMFVALMVLEIYSFSYKYAGCPKVEHEHSKSCMRIPLLPALLPLCNLLCDQVYIILLTSHICFYCVLVSYFMCIFICMTRLH